MAERLTEFVTKNCSEPFYRFNENSHISVRYRYCANIDKAINKLGKLEDILEKYGIESVEELEDKIICYEENKDVNLGLKLDIKKLEQELDAWKRACELMCKTIQNVYPEPFYRFAEDIPDYFYQQAKKEGENK